MLSVLRGRVDEVNENFNTGTVNIKMEIENIKKNPSEMKNTRTKMKNTLQGINSGVDEAEDQTSNFEDKVAENNPIRTAKGRNNPKK